jgi:ABC-type glycerol-3-phosphate transport system substrate-binding protein
VGVGTITYDREEYGDQIQYLGYPTKEGAKNFVYGVYPLCIRKTASDEDKKIAYTLMLMMMSHDGQRAIMKRNISFGISIRKDVFEEQIQWVNELTLEQAKWEGSEGREKLKAQLEADAEYYRTIVNGASVIKSLPSEIEAILEEELSEYTSGNISKDQFIDHLQNRIGLYVNENR